jgi:hypothetical protein
MSNPDEFRIFLMMFVAYLPTFLVCLVAGAVILARWQEGADGSLWALMGFGLAALLCILMPAGQAALQHWVFQSGEIEARRWAMTTFSMVGSVLHAAIYLMLLVAVFAGRAKSGAAMPSSASGLRQP